MRYYAIDIYSTAPVLYLTNKGKVFSKNLASTNVLADYVQEA